jgi:NADH dehydrogenase FAD-containing subunit
MKQLVLLGSGPSHLQVLKELAQAPLPGAQVTLVAPSPREVFSNLLPGWVAGRYSLDECVLPLAPLAEAARVNRVEASVAWLALGQRQLRLSDGRTLHYDVLSLDTEPTVERDAIAGAREHALFVRPVEHFIPGWEALRERAEQRTLSIVVIGSGVAAVEFAFCVQDKLASRARVALVTEGGALLPSCAGALRSRVMSQLRRSKIALFEDRCIGITAGQVQLERGPRLGCDAPWVVMEYSAAPWLAESGLALDSIGRVRQRPTLQSLSHDEVFVAGDSLALNLRRFVAGGELVADRAKSPTWQLVACGAQCAVAGWGPLSLEGRWVGAWKARRDRKSVARYAPS